MNWTEDDDAFLCGEKPKRNETRFWMVWTPKGVAPTRIHQSHEAALNEARRLAQRDIGTTFYILVAEKGVMFESVPPKTEWAMH